MNSKRRTENRTAKLNTNGEARTQTCERPLLSSKFSPHHKSKREHREGRNRRRNRRREEDVPRRPVRRHEHPADRRSDDGTHAPDAKPCAHASGSNVGRVIRTRECVQAGLTANDAPAGYEDDDIEESEREGGLAYQGHADGSDDKGRA